MEWVALSFSRRSSPPVDRTHFSCIGRRILLSQCVNFFSINPPKILHDAHNVVGMVKKVQGDLSGLEQTTTLMQPQFEPGFVIFVCLFVFLEVIVLSLTHNNQRRDSENTLYTIGLKEN